MYKADGFDEAIVGSWVDDDGMDRIIYSFEKCVKVIMLRDNLTLDEAREHMYFNVVPSSQFVGAPIFAHAWEFED